MQVRNVHQSLGKQYPQLKSHSGGTYKRASPPLACARCCARPLLQVPARYAPRLGARVGRPGKSHPTREPEPKPDPCIRVDPLNPFNKRIRYGSTLKGLGHIQVDPNPTRPDPTCLPGLIVGWVHLPCFLVSACRIYVLGSDVHTRCVHTPSWCTHTNC